MTHLTATNAANAHGQLLAIDRAGQKFCFRVYALPAVRHRIESIFYSPVANFLELRDGDFHYSVIGGTP